MPWECQANPKLPKRILFRGVRFNPETREREPILLRARIICGRMTREVHSGLLALKYPFHRERLSADWTVTTPRAFAAQDNTGANRKFIVLSSPTYPELVLHFDKPIPLGDDGLAEALRVAFSRPGSRERVKEIRDEDGAGQHDGQAEAEVQPKPRYHTYGAEASADGQGDGVFYVRRQALKRKAAQNRARSKKQKENWRAKKRALKEAENADRRANVAPGAGPG